MQLVPFVGLPGFRRFDDHDFFHLFPENIPSFEYYEKFKQAIFKAAEKKEYLPVMRMCDGEYIYSIGKRKSYYQGFASVIKNQIGKLIHTHTTSWGENYTRAQNLLLKKKFPQLLKFISEHGYIANHFLYTPSHFCEQYIHPIIKWYAQNDITINNNNFSAFYFVYVLLNGPDSLLLYKNRRILVISSFKGDKRNSTEMELRRRGAVAVFFQTISATQSLLDTIDLNPFKGNVDIVLIAAGIGSANILVQCKVLEVPCIDSGFCLECLANPDIRSERIYGVPDQEF
jgi:hypothetical protein